MTTTLDALLASVGFADIFSRKGRRGRQAAVSFSARVSADALDALGRADDAAARQRAMGSAAGP